MNIQAWETEHAVAVVWGTHDPSEATKAYERYLRECGFEVGSEEWPDDLASMWGDAVHWWGDPAGDWFEDERPWSDEWSSPVAIDGWIPYLTVAQ